MDVRSIAAVIFDMDGVLCDSEPFICEAATKMFAQRFGLHVNPQDFIPFIGAGEDRYLGGVAEKYGVTLQMPDDKRTTYEIYLQIIQGRLQPLPGAVTFIDACQISGLKLAVATSADEMKLTGNLKQIGLSTSTFGALVYGELVERKKPDPQIFLLAGATLNVAPENCLVVEDAINGVKAAKAAGSLCLGITTSFSEEVLKSTGADWTAPHLAHVPPDLLRELGALGFEPRTKGL